MSAGLYYIFCDEKYHNDEAGRNRFLTGYIASPQNAWNIIPQRKRNLIEPSNVSRLERILHLLDTINGIAVITYADIEPEILPTNDRDTTDDVADIARPDHIWGNVIALGLAATAKWLALQGHIVKNIDVYYDTRSIKEMHRQALEAVVVDTLSSIIRTTNSPKGYKPNFRRFNDTPKAHAGDRRNKFQSGTYVADRLLQYAKRIIDCGKMKRIHTQDISTRINDYFKRNFAVGNSIS